MGWTSVLKTGGVVTTRAIWILGTPFSGSTITQRLVGRFRDVAVVGEIDRIAAFGMHPAGADNPRTYVSRCAYCWAHDCDCPLWTEDLFGRLGAKVPGPDVYDILADASGRGVILDSSKTPWWFLNIVSHPDFGKWSGSVFAIHCVRHPFAFALSLANRTGESLERAVLLWTIVNRDALAVLNRAEKFIPVLTVYHNRVLKNPGKLLSALSTFLDLGEAGEERVQHYLGGNAAAWPFKAKPEQITAPFGDSIDYFASADPVAADDGRWRAKMDMGTRWRLAGLPGVREMCAVLGIDIDALILS